MSQKIRNIEIVDEIMGAIIQTGEWYRISQEDPMIRQAEAKLNALLQELYPLIGKENRERLWDAIMDCSCAGEDAAILYGIHVAEALRAVSADPAALSQHILERTGRVPA